MAFSLDPVPAWWLDKLRDGQVELGKGWPETVTTNSLFKDYLTYADDMRINGGRRCATSVKS